MGMICRIFLIGSVVVVGGGIFVVKYVDGLVWLVVVL